MKMDNLGQMLSSWEDVRTTFEHHFKHYANHGLGENALLGMRAEGAVTLTYAGRVVYELFQNAVDQAKNRLTLVHFDGKTLTVGNDGNGISVDPNYDYRMPKVDGRSDFHALCALHVSNKNPNVQFGSKGIGFRSVFGISNQVQVWSRCQDGGWWGLELKEGLRPSDWSDSAMPDWDKKIRLLGDQPRPSFQFPRPLRLISSGDPILDGCDGSITTIIKVDVGNEDHQRQIAQEVKRLLDTRFQFVSLRYSNRCFLINDTKKSSQDGWPMVSQAKHHNGYPDLAALAQKAKHPVPAPRIAVAWPPQQTSEEQQPIGLFYNHLPTRMSTGLPVDIHGDFQVKEDREGMSLDADNDVGKYNIALLCRAADAHVEALCAEALETKPRVDFWCLADRPENTHPAWIEAIRDRLFPSNKFDVWVEIASNYFKQDHNESAYRDFWNATQRWIENLVGYGCSKQTWKNSARALCDILAERSIRLIPILTTSGQRAAALPLRQDKSGQRANRRVFFWSPKNEGEIPRLPNTLVEMGRVVTYFSLEAFENPAGIQSFTAVELLPELRQVPNEHRPHQSMGTLSDDEQGDLLRFAYCLTQDRIISHFAISHFAWRAFAENENKKEIGRALATMYLPTVDKKWEPARQLTEDRVNVTRLSEIMGPVENLSDFLRLLGVAPACSIPLVEGGLAGRMPPIDTPPYPQEPGNRPIAKIAPILDKGSLVQAVIATLKGLTEDNDRSEVFACVRSDCWLDPDLFETFDGIPALTDYIAPQDVVLDRNREERIFFAVPKPDTDHEAWCQLRVPKWPDDEVLAPRVPSILWRLFKRIPSTLPLSASIALSLSRFYNQLIKLKPDLLIESTEPIPVLIEQAGSYRWRVDGEDVWLAQSDDRQKLRRFFRDLPMVASDGGRELAQRLQVKTVKLREKVQPSLKSVTESLLAKEIRQYIDSHLDVFAAVADQSRLAMKQLAEGRIQQAWRQPYPIVQVEDAWVEVRAEGTDRESISWHKDVYEDVFYLQERDGDDLGVIIFDIPPISDDEKDPKIPLRYFGDALAKLLTNNIALGPSFAQVLSAIDEGRIDDFVERYHLENLRKEWVDRLRPATPEQKQALIEKLAKVCVNAEEVLKKGHILRGDLHVNLTVTTSRQVESLLQTNLPPELVGYLPKVLVTAENEKVWREWFESHKDMLNLLIPTLGGEFPNAWEQKISDHVRAKFEQLDFSVPRLVVEILSEWRISITEQDLDSRLKGAVAAVSKFNPVSAPPSIASDVGWKAGQGHSPVGHGGPPRKITDQDKLNESIACSLVGDAAERALLKWVVSQVTALQHSSGFKDTLLSVFKTGSIRDKVKEALEKGELEKALYISDLWSGAGFDILGLEDKDGKLQPVRYECKSLLHSASGCAVVFLTRNELAVAKRIKREEKLGRWVLVGVQPDGTPVDLTNFVTPLLEQDEGPLKPLYELGFEPDGLRLRIERSSAVS